MVRFILEEGNSNTFDGVVGYVPAQNNEDKGYMTGRLEFLFRNLFGTGRFLDVFWEKKDLPWNWET